MSTATLKGLLDYLYATLSPSNMQWLGEHLIEYAKKDKDALVPYTMDEIDRFIDESEHDFETGNYKTTEEVFHTSNSSTAL